MTHESQSAGEAGSIPNRGCLESPVSPLSAMATCVRRLSVRGSATQALRWGANRNQHIFTESARSQNYGYSDVAVSTLRGAPWCIMKRFKGELSVQYSRYAQHKTLCGVAVCCSISEVVRICGKVVSDVCTTLYLVVETWHEYLNCTVLP